MGKTLDLKIKKTKQKLHDPFTKNLKEYELDAKPLTLNEYRLEKTFRWYKYLLGDWRWFSFKWNKFRNRDRMLKIYMELINGDVIEFFVSEIENGFRLGKRRYFFDDVSKYFNASAGFWCYDYHQSMALPIQRIFPVSEIAQTLIENDLSDIVYSIRPETLDSFMYARLGEELMNSTEGGYLKKIFWMCVFILFGVVISVIVTYFMNRTA